MADFAKPTITSDYALLLDEIKAAITSVAVMFDGTTDSNIPSGAVKLNSQTNRFQRYTNGQWVNATVSGFADNSLAGSTLMDGSVGAGKLLLGADQYLTWSTPAGNRGLLRQNVLGPVELNYNSEVWITQNGVPYWKFDNGSLLPKQPNTGQKLGAVDAVFAEVYAANIYKTANIINQGDSMTVGSYAAAGTLTLAAGGNDRWEIAVDGALKSLGGDLGAALSPISYGWFTNLSASSIVCAGGPMAFHQSSNVSYLFWQGNSLAWYIDGDQNLKPGVANARSIGTSALPLASLYAATVQTGGVSASTGGLNLATLAAGDLTLTTNNVGRWRVHSGGDVLPNLNNTYSIGSGAAKVKDIWAGGKVTSSWFCNPGGNAVFGSTDPGTLTQITQNGSVFISIEADGKLSLWNIDMTGTTPADAGQWAKIRINGTFYRIKLYSGA